MIADIALSKSLNIKNGELYPQLKAAGKIKAYHFINDTLKQKLYQQMSDEQWPQGPCRDDWKAVFEIDLPWLEDDHQGYRRPLLDAIMAQAYSVASGQYLSAKHRAFVSAMREFNTQQFEKMYAASCACLYLELGNDH